MARSVKSIHREEPSDQLIDFYKEQYRKKGLSMFHDESEQSTESDSSDDSSERRSEDVSFAALCRFCQKNMVALIVAFLLFVVLTSMVLPLIVFELEPNSSLHAKAKVSLPGWKGRSAANAARSLEKKLPSLVGATATSTPKSATTTQKDGCSCNWETGVDMFGGDLFSIPAPTEEACCKHCSKEKECAAVSFSGMVCYLKTSDVQKKHKENVRSAYKCNNQASSPAVPAPGIAEPQPSAHRPAPFRAAANPSHSAHQPPAEEEEPVGDQDCKCKLFPDHDFFGGDIKTVRASSVQSCCELCINHPNCFTWTWDMKDLCYLKGAIGKASPKGGLVSGRSCRQTPPPTPPPPPPNRDMAQDSIKRSMQHAWRGYSDKCFGQDELLPLSNRCGNWLGAGLTVIDSLSTLWIMGMHEEFDRAKTWIQEELTFNFSKDISFFETVIRIVGGLVSAFDLTGERVFITKAKEMADKLAPAFNSPHKIPWAKVNIQTGRTSNPSWSGKASVLAEVGTIQMEYFALSRHSGNKQYRDLAQGVIDHLDNARTNIAGLYPLYIDTNTGNFRSRKISFGGCGDSFYEYLLKTWLLTGRKHDQFKRMYKESIDSMIAHMIARSPDGHTYLPTLNGNLKLKEMEHLTCFTGGMLALGSVSGIVDSETADRHLQVAKELAETCYEMYHTTATGVGPESARFVGSMRPKDPAYHLRPETVETLYYLWRVTKDDTYRRWGWDIYTAIEEHCRQQIGYATIKNVNLQKGHLQYQDKMESFFLAETLKYLYLLFAEDDAQIPIMGLDDEGGQMLKEGGKFFVFNTEAHPIRAWIE